MDYQITEKVEVSDSGVKTGFAVDANLPAYIVGGSLLVGAILISASLIYGADRIVKNLAAGGLPVSVGSQSAAAQPAALAQQPAAAAGTPVSIVLKPTTAYLGNSNAKIMVVEYADYQCPYCEKWYSTVMPDIKTKYISTGKIKFVYQDFAFLGADSNTAAEASHCAADQNKFWQYHDYLFGHQGQEGSGWASADYQRQFALIPALGLNVPLFNQCLDSGKYKQEVLDETAAGKSYGVSGTPAIFILKSNNLSVDPVYINSQLQILQNQNKMPVVNLPDGNTFISGALPASAFEQAINAALASK